MAKKAFNHTAFFKNAKRVIQHEKNGAYVLTGYTGSGKTELLKELIMVFEDVYDKSTNSLEMFLFDGKDSTFKMFDNSKFIAKRSATFKDLANNDQILHPLTSALRIPSQVTNGVGGYTRKLVVIDECSAFKNQIPNDIKYLYWLVEHAKEREMTVIIADQIESLDIFNSPSINDFLRMIDFGTFKVRNSSRLIDVPYLSDDEMIKFQQHFQEEFK